MKIARGTCEKLRLIYYFYAPSKALLILLAFLTILYGLIEMLAVGALFPVLEAGISQVASESGDVIGEQTVIKRLYFRLGEVLGLSYLLTSSVVLVTVTVLSFLYKTFYTYYSQRVLTYLWVHHQKCMYLVLSRAEYAFYTNEKQGTLVYNGTVAVESIAAVLDSTIRGVSETVKVLFLIGLLLLSSWKITLVVTMVGIFYVFFSRIIIKHLVNNSSRESLKLNQKQHQNLNEFITGIQLIKVFDKTAYWMKQYVEMAEQYVEMAEKNAKLFINIQMGSLLPNLIIQLIIGIGIGIAGIYIGNQPAERIAYLVPQLGLFVIASGRITTGTSSAVSYLAAISTYCFIQYAVLSNTLIN